MASFGDLFNLALLFAIFLSGLAHALVQPAAAGVMIVQAGSLLQLNQAPSLHPVAFAHLCLISVFMAYLPYTHMAHMVLKYFTYHSVRWDDRSADQLPGNKNRIRSSLGYPLRWSAPHIQSGNGRTTWADISIASDIKERKVERH